jgi:hypothetical protein
MKSVPNFISYLHDFFWNCSQFLAIYFELFLSGVFLIRKTLTSGSHQSDVAVRAGPAWQRTVAAWLPHAAPRPRIKCAVETAFRPAARAASPRPVPTAPPPLSEATSPSMPEARRCPAVSAVTRFIHGECRPSRPLIVFRPWSVELTSHSLLPVVGPPPATVAPPRRKNATAELVFSPSPSTRSSSELFSPSPCPVGSLTAVGALPPPFAPPPPQWRRRRPHRNARPESGDRSGVRRAVAGCTGRGRPGKRRPCTAHTGRASVMNAGRARCPRGPS